MSLTSIIKEREERAEKAVQKGITLLDEKGPENWRERIDFGQFDIASLGACVLGQVYGDWGTGMELLFPGLTVGRSDVAAYYGFDGVDLYTELQDEWTEPTAQRVNPRPERVNPNPPEGFTDLTGPRNGHSLYLQQQREGESPWLA